MDETTTNTPVVDDSGAPVAQPDVQQNVAADNTTQEQSTDTSTNEPVQSEQETDNSDDDDLSDYWSKKGIDITTPEGQAKAAKSYREAEKAMHQKGQQASELERQINTPQFNPEDSKADQAIAIANQLHNEKVIREWRESAGVTPQEDKAMGKYAQENSRLANQLLAGQITLDEFRAIAVAANPVDTAKIKQQGGQEALEKLANNQRATAVQGNAVNTTPTAALTKDNVEEWYNGLGTAGRQNPENQAILQSILAS